MPTREQIERGERARRDAMDAALGLTPFTDEEWEEHKTEEHSRYPSDVAEMRAALVAAAPTPEEHARGIGAASAAWNATYVACISLQDGSCTENSAGALRAAIAAYIAATWGADG